MQPTNAWRTTSRVAGYANISAANHNCVSELAGLAHVKLWSRNWRSLVKECANEIAIDCNLALAGQNCPPIVDSTFST
jgi:hypothetical protein